LYDKNKDLANDMITNKFVIGLLAHVDSGKTTLAESLLYNSGSIRKLGRVDHKDTFLDTYELEKKRGITIFSKQAQLKIADKSICILDTPGHVDFAAEMERTLQVIDYAILIVSGADGVQGHTQTLWKLLKKYKIPVFVFVNKMDQQGTDKDKLIKELQSKLDSSIIDFTQYKNPTETFYENVSMCEENLMNKFLDCGQLTIDEIRLGIKKRKIYPCLFGSALKQQGIIEFMEALDQFLLPNDYPDEFSARVYKISRDDQNNRLTYIKMTGGSLKTKTLISKGEWSEKADQLRIYSGGQYQPVSEVEAGDICAVTGLTYTFAGEGLGIEGEPEVPLLEPVMTYKIIVPEGINIHDFYNKLNVLEEEEPQLHIVWDKDNSEIHAQVMGEVQMEILKNIVQERFGVDIEFGAGNIVYKETIAEPVIGIGHFEPLRHYAEVHLLMEPLEHGRGLEFVTDCSEDILDKNWQRLILTHLEERHHKGVLTGSEITDMRITVIAGRAHKKHTEGGDFRQATYRAVRNGMKKAKSVLLEPVYEFKLEIPSTCIGRAMTDIQNMQGRFEAPLIENDTAFLTGTAPVVTLQNYQAEVNSYTHGKGSLVCTLKGYDVCHNADEVIEMINYDSEADLANPTGSVFCSHGAGFLVDWDSVSLYAHVNNGISQDCDDYDYDENSIAVRKAAISELTIGQDEIEGILNRTYRKSGSDDNKRRGWKKTITAHDDSNYKGTENSYIYANKDEYLLVDGYNIIFAWENLNELSKTNIDSARDKLLDIMCNYQGYTKKNVIVVFDAYKVQGGQGSEFDYHNIHVVYTKEAQTADQYIEKFTNQLAKQYNITVATSDRLEQMIIWGQGARRLSAKGLQEEVQSIENAITTHVNTNNTQAGTGGRNYLQINVE
jgi:small GTP-binding protein